VERIRLWALRTASSPAVDAWCRLAWSERTGDEPDVVEWAPFRTPAASFDGSNYPFIDVVLPDPDALSPRPSTAGRDILPKSHPLSSRQLFQGSFGITGVYQKRWWRQQHAILSDPCSIDDLSHVLHIPSRGIYNPDNYGICFVLCACISR